MVLNYKIVIYSGLHSREVDGDWTNFLIELIADLVLSVKF